MPTVAGDPLLDAALGICFIGLVAIGLVAAVPWRALGARRLSALLRWAALPMLALALVYEALMPAHFDTRLDLVVLLPLYLVVLVSSLLRWIGPRRRRRH
jgi:hypothetical protein